MRIFLIGFMGSGKTTFGRKLANRLGMKFIDLDKSIEQSQQMFVTHIFKQFGEEQFRIWEKEELQSLSTESNLIIACGGGTPCFNNNMDLMNKTGITIYIKMTAAALHSRLRKAKLPRPLIDSKSHEELSLFIEKLLIQREPFYNQAQITIDGLRPNFTNLTDQINTR